MQALGARRDAHGAPEPAAIGMQLGILGGLGIDLHPARGKDIQGRMQCPEFVQARHAMCLDRLLGPVEHEAELPDPEVAVKADAVHEQRGALPDSERPGRLRVESDGQRRLRWRGRRDGLAISYCIQARVPRLVCGVAVDGIRAERRATLPWLHSGRSMERVWLNLGTEVAVRALERGDLPWTLHPACEFASDPGQWGASLINNAEVMTACLDVAGRHRWSRSAPMPET